MAIILRICLLLFFGAEAQVFGAGAPPASDAIATMVIPLVNLANAFMISSL